MKTGHTFYALILATSITLTACQSVPDTTATANDQAEVAAELAILKQKQQKYDAVVEEWQSMREGLQRLLVVEEELGLLIGQLEQMSQPQPSATSQQQNNVSQATEQTAMAAPTQPASPSKFQNESDMPAKYALQLTAVTSPTRLSSLWQDLSRKHPTLLADLPANYQKIKVKSTDYFRLKAGAFVTEQEATERCIALKTAGVGCIVSDYNNAPLKDISQ